MSIKIMSTVWASNLPDAINTSRRDTAKLTLLKLADNSDDYGVCQTSIKSISRGAAMSHETVTLALRDLQLAGLIHAEQEDLDTSIYYINIPLIELLQGDFKGVK